MRITMVKKIKADGSPCRKCADVERRLAEGGYLPRIDRVVVADERDPASEGMVLAGLHGVEVAPFFIVERDDGSTQVYTIYFRFLKEVLAGETDAAREAAEILDRSPGVDML
jgi:hypothetical protein